jgi:hypothetical protein
MPCADFSQLDAVYRAGAQDLYNSSSQCLWLTSLRLLDSACCKIDGNIHQRMLEQVSELEVEYMTGWRDRRNESG